MPQNLNAMLDSIDVEDGEIKYDVAIGQSVVYPIQIEFLNAEPVPSEPHQFLVEEVEANHYRLKGQVIYSFQGPHEKMGSVIFHVEPFKFIWQMKLAQWLQLSVGGWLEVRGSLRMNGWDVGPRLESKMEQNQMVFGKYFVPYNCPVPDIYQHFKVKAIQRYAQIADTNDHRPAEQVQKTDIEGRTLCDDGIVDFFFC